MSKDADARRAAARKRLADHLAALDQQTAPEPFMESEMLALIVSGALQGEDISQRYPEFYRTLLENAELREAFLDTLESLEAERTGRLENLPATAAPPLDFLRPQTTAPAVSKLDASHWRATLQRSLEQIQAVLTPRELLYRADSMLEDPWYTLLREEIQAAGATYTLLLDCTISDGQPGALAAYLNLAVTPGTPDSRQGFPMRASLEWGDYRSKVLLTEEGRARFADIPLALILDPAMQQVLAGLTLTLETAA